MTWRIAHEQKTTVVRPKSLARNVNEGGLEELKVKKEKETTVVFEHYLATVRPQQQ
jgi:hypothetical protein